MDRTLADLIKFIVWRATEVSNGLSTLALVKFLYLADLYHAESTGGETLTKFPWIFYHFGPYCTQSYKAIDEAVRLGVICQNTYESKFEEGKENRWFCWDQKDEPVVTLPQAVEVHLRSAIKRFQDTRDLMNYVYSETAPMHDPQERQLLDFSTAEKKVNEPPVEMKQLSHKKVKKAHELIQKMKEARTKNMSMPRVNVAPIYDANYFSFEKMLNEEDGATPQISGKMVFFD